ncbi:response regulator transcription factor [Angustibacter aerolatus]
MQVLLVEDDDRGAAALGDLLSRHGFVVTRAGGVAQALERFGPRTEVVLVDLGLPDGDGFDLCTRLRAVRDVPILITTARSGVRARVHGLHLGADDYLVKPFDVRELMARIHAVVRRTRVAEPAADVPDRLRVGDVEIDFAQRVVRSAGREVALTPKELAVLEVLAGDRGLVVRRERLLSEVWQTAGGDQHTLDVHVASIRSKTAAPHLIETVRGVGYRLGQG